MSIVNCFSQNIGISTDGSAPETGVLLDVKGINSKTVTATQNIFQIKSYDASTDALKLRLGLATNATYSLSYGIIEVPEYVGGAVSAYRNMVLQPSGGNVGIGTISPNCKLHLRAPSPELNIESTSGPAGSSSILTFGHSQNSSTIPTGKIYSYLTDGSAALRAGHLIFQTATVGVLNDRMIITDNGNVGIGCTAPQYKLHVIGDIASSATIRGVNAYVTGAITACSDIRYKKDITPLPNALSNIMQLQGVNYFWKTKEFPEKQFTETKQLGFIAQEIEKIYPEVVMTDKDGYKSVDYSRLTPVLVEAIKELKKENDRLKAEVGSIKTDYDNRIKKLESVLDAKAEK